ncbi:hypothetical protein [Zymomonas mobilis]|uniref:hypothetical protein n=1 Tax=Zymomonas mobilis TaxID=542 RepID=UPI0039E8B6A0
MDNNSTNRPRLGSAIFDPLLDNITNNTPNSVLSSSWLKLLSSNQYPNILKIYGDPSEKNQYFALTDRNTGYPISQRDLLSKNSNSTITNSNTFSSPRYIDPQKMSRYFPIDDDPNFTAGISGEGLKSIEAGVHFNSPNLNINASGGGGGKIATRWL